MDTTTTTSSSNSSLETEFSFPTDTAQIFMGSPPLWQRGSFNKESNYDHNYSSSHFKTTDTGNHVIILDSSGAREIERRSFSSVEERLLLHRPIEMEESDRMDLLWEDLNDDDHHNYHKRGRSRRQGSLGGRFDDEHCSSLGHSSSSSSTSSASEMPPRCMPVPSRFKLPRGVVGGGAAADGDSRKKQPGVVVVVKVLKRWLLFRQHTVMKRNHRSQYW